MKFIGSVSTQSKIYPELVCSFYTFSICLIKCRFQWQQIKYEEILYSSLCISELKGIFKLKTIISTDFYILLNCHLKIDKISGVRIIVFYLRMTIENPQEHHELYQMIIFLDYEHNLFYNMIRYKNIKILKHLYLE